MSEPILTAQEVLAWYETTSDHWRKFLGEHPDILALPCDIASGSTVAQLMQHIVAVELRWAQRLARIPETSFEQVPYDSVDALYATHDRATAIIKQVLAADTNWDQVIDFQTRSYGPARASLKTILFHDLLHTLRHYAQLTTLARQHGYKPTWQGDYLFMGIQLA